MRLVRGRLLWADAAGGAGKFCVYLQWTVFRGILLPRWINECDTEFVRMRGGVRVRGWVDSSWRVAVCGGIHVRRRLRAARAVHHCGVLLRRRGVHPGSVPRRLLWHGVGGGGISKWHLRRAVQCRFVLSRGINERDVACVPRWLLLRRGVRVALSMPCGVVRSCSGQDDGGMFWGLRRRVLLPRGRDDSNRRRDRRRLPDWGVQHRGRCNVNDICVHGVPRWDLRFCNHADDCGLLGQLCRGILLPRGLCMRERRHQRGHVQHLAEAVRRGVLLPRGRDDSNRRRDRRRLPDWGVQHHGRSYLNNVVLHAVPRGDLRLCYNADVRGLLGSMRGRVLLRPRRRVHQRRHRRWNMRVDAEAVLGGILLPRWRGQRRAVPNRFLFHGWCIDRGLHAMSCRRIWQLVNPDIAELFWAMRSGFLVRRGVHKCDRRR